MSGPLKVLMVEDSEDDAALVLRVLERSGYQVQFKRTDSHESFTAALDSAEWDCIISDFYLPSFGAFAALSLVKQRNLDIPFIVVSGVIGEETAVAAMKAGAHDYVMKGNLKRLAPAVEREIREAGVRRDHRRAEQSLRATEEQLRHSQKMEAIGRLAGGVAHDFNNLLTAIIGRASLLSRKLFAGDPMKTDLDEIVAAGMRASGLTKQLLAFSRKQLVRPQVLDLNVVLLNFEKMLRRLIPEDIELVFSLSPELGLLRADPNQIEQVILNLAVNSRDAMPRGGRITIETANAIVDEPDTGEPSVLPGHYIVLALSDTGVGMDADTRSRIFEPFFTTKELGTGLGLSTVYGIISQSGGGVIVSSEPEMGATFKVYLPRIGATEARAVAPQAASRLAVAPRGSETILVVEDDHEVRKIACLVLRSSGYKVIEAGNGDEALLASEQHENVINLLLTDVRMPGMNGPDLAARLSGLRPGIKTLLMSGYTDSLGPLPDGGVAFIQKPFTPDALSRKVRDVLDSQPEPAPPIQDGDTSAPLGPRALSRE